MTKNMGLVLASIDAAALGHTYAFLCSVQAVLTSVPVTLLIAALGQFGGEKYTTRFK